MAKREGSCDAFTFWIMDVDPRAVTPEMIEARIAAVVAGERKARRPIMRQRLEKIRDAFIEDTLFFPSEVSDD